MNYDRNAYSVPPQLRSLGPAQARLLLTLAERFGLSFSVAEARQVLDLPRQAIAQALSDLAAKGWLMRIGRGTYLVVPLEAGPDTATYPANRYLAAAAVAGQRDYFLSYRTAMELHDMTIRPSRTAYVSTTARLSRRDLAGFQIRPVTIKPERMWGRDKVEAAPGHAVWASDVARTFVDCVDIPEYAGGITEVAAGIGLLGDSLPVESTVEAALRFGKKSVIKRLGFLLETLVPAAQSHLGPLLERVDRSPHLLDPMLPKSGGFVSRWGLYLNVSEDELRAEVSA